MTQEEKELFIKDLCARLPYGVKLRYVEDLVVKKESHIITLNNIYLEHILNGDADIKPYLRPMSSMTEEEFKEVTEIDRKRNIFSARHLTWYLDGEIIDFFNRKMLDWRNLIPLGLALEAPEEMYKTKTE